MNALLTRTWSLLRANPLLFLPVILYSLVVALLTGISGGAPSLMAILSIFLLDRAMEGGWLNQVKAVLIGGKKPDWNDFLEGVARYFGVLLSGSAALLLLAFVCISLSSLLAEVLVGMPDGELLKKLLAPETWQASSDVLAKHGDEVQHLMTWGSIVLVGVLMFLALAFFLFLWQQYCVFANVTWLEAWRCSQTLVRRCFAFFLMAILLWSLPKGLIFLGSVSPSGVGQLLALGLDLFCRTFFLVLFSQLVILLDPVRLGLQQPDTVVLSQESRDARKKDEP